MMSRIFFWASIIFGLAGVSFLGMLSTTLWMLPVMLWVMSGLTALWNIGAILKEK